MQATTATLAHLPRCRKAWAVRLEIRLRTDGAPGGHVEHAADARTSPVDATFACMGAAVAVVGGHTDERGDLTAIQRTQFRDVSDEARGRSGRSRAVS